MDDQFLHDVLDQQKTPPAAASHSSAMSSEFQQSPVSRLESGLAALDLDPPAMPPAPALEISSETEAQQLEPVHQLEHLGYRSSVLLRREAAGLPRLTTQCATCRMALWIEVERTQLQAHCRVLNQITWSVSQPTEISDCDGPEMANQA